MIKNVSRTFLLLSIILFYPFSTQAQNHYEEIVACKITGGKIIVPVKINGKEYKFLFDILSKPAILEEKAGEMGIIATNKPSPKFTRPEVDVISTAVINNMSIGDNIFFKSKEVFVIKDDYLKSLGIDGVIDCSSFNGYVLTINAKDQTITTSSPYKPSYVQLKNKLKFVDKKIEITVNGKPVFVTLDFVNSYMLYLNDEDCRTIGLSATGANLMHGKIVPSDSYKAATIDIKEYKGVDWLLANNNIDSQPVYSADANMSAIGSAILDKGVISIDQANSSIYFQPYETLKTPLNKTAPEMPQTDQSQGDVISLNRPLFIEKIFNFREEEEWKYRGDKPAIIDFWASWCGPCKKLSPIYDELAKEYKDKIIFYKLNVDQEKEIARYFKISTLPALLYIPVEGKPVKVAGAFPKEKIIEMINKNILR